MSLSPETFERELKLRMGEEYRLRYSSLTSTWNIEQKIGRGVWELPANDWDDTAIRARDGYALVCSVHPRPFLICPECNLQVPLPHLTIGEAHCHYCEARTGTNVSYFAGYFPLCERLIQRLERTSPKRAAEWRKEMNEKNRILRQQQDRDYDNETEAILADYYNRVMDRPQVGYGGSITSKGDWTTT